MRTETEWREYLAEAQQRRVRMHARLAAGESEADAAHAEGFLTRKDIETDVARIRSARGLS